MGHEVWGLLGPASLSGRRRTRTLGLGAAVRSFNDLAVPGLGSVWFGKQLVLATLGVVVAESARRAGAKVSNIEVANAVEALACCLAFDDRQWAPDRRLRGRTKLPEPGEDLSFRRVRRTSFYVTQTLRMGTVQALPALGLVTARGTRFNAFESSVNGCAVLEVALAPYRPFRRSVQAHLVDWVLGRTGAASMQTATLREALSPCAALSPDSRALLRARLELGSDRERSADTLRRRQALAWVGSLHGAAPGMSASDFPKPPALDGDHWDDIRAGALFFTLMDAAVAVLDAVEAHMGPDRRQMPVADAARDLESAAAPSGPVRILALRQAARRFLDAQHRQPQAVEFARQCAADCTDDLLRALVGRDGTVLRLLGQDIGRGPAYRGATPAAGPPEEDDADPRGDDIPIPHGVSHRLRNLYRLHLDLQGDLDAWLERQAERSAP